MLTTVIFFKRVETTNQVVIVKNAKFLGGENLDEDQSLKIFSKTSSLVFVRRYDILFKHI